MDEKRRDDEFGGVFERVMLLGLGVVGVTKDAVNDIAVDLMARGRMSEAEAHDTAGKLAARAERMAEKMRETVAEQTRAQIDQMGIATKDDIHQLEQRISDLSALIATRGVSSSSEPYVP